MNPWLRRGVAALIALVGIALAAAEPAGAHGGGSEGPTATNFRTTITSIVPAVDGVTLGVIDAGSRLELHVFNSAEVIVFGYQDEPYLRVGTDGVFQNLLSPATYLNASRDGGDAVPSSVDPAAAPEWRRVSGGTTVRWHDHRAHWMGGERPPMAAAEADSAQIVNPAWSVPFTVNGEPVLVTGQLSWVPPPNTGWWLAATVAAAAGSLLALLLGGRFMPPALAGSVVVLDAVVTFGEAAASPDTAINRVLFFGWTPFALLGVSSLLLAARRRRSGPLPAALITGFVLAMMSGFDRENRADRLGSWSNSQLSTVLPPTLTRCAALTGMAVAGALSIKFAIDMRRQPRIDPAPPAVAPA